LAVNNFVATSNR